MIEFVASAPPSSSGLGQGPLKAQTGVRFPLGAQHEPLNNVERFLSMLRFDSRGNLDKLGIRLDTLDIKKLN